MIGPCAATPAELERLAATGVDDTAITAWPGSYAVVEVTGEGTTIWTDVGGACPIYTVNVASGTVWASSSRALAPLASGRVDVAWLAALLLVPSAPELVAGHSAFVGVAAVPPGHRLALPIGGRRSQRPTWRACRPDRYATAEAASRLRRVLDEAVQVRVAHACRPSTDCSGGLDSTSLTLLAADHVGSGRQVQAITVHPVGVHAGGDLTYALETALGEPRIAHHLLPLSVEHSPYSRFDLLPASDEPAPSTVIIARAVAGFDLLRGLGSDCHLTGDGGDTILGGHPRYLADLARAGRLVRLTREALGWARLRREPLWPLLADITRAGRTSHAASLRALASALAATPKDASRSPRQGFVSAHLPPAESLWATPNARLLAAQSADLVANAASDGNCDRADEAALLTLSAIQTVGRTARADAQVAEAFGVALHNPFTDTRVIDACLAVPTWRRISPRAYKPLLVAAMTGLLPPAVAARRTKGDFTPDHYLGLRANADRVRALADGRLASLGLVDPPGLRQAVDRACAGLPVDFSTFESVITAEVWLRTVDATPPVEWVAVGAL